MGAGGFGVSAFQKSRDHGLTGPRPARGRCDLNRRCSAAESERRHAGGSFALWGQERQGEWSHDAGFG